MKKPLFVLLLTAVITAAVFPSVVRIGNDTWSMGLSENDDDLLTWSVGYEQNTTGGISVSADVFSFTDRGSGKGSDFSRSRYDMIEAFVSWGLDSSDVMDMPLSVYGKISGGASLRGNLAGEYVQNFVHRFMGIPEVDLPYPEGVSVFPSGVVEAGLSYSFSPFSMKVSGSGGFRLGAPYAGASLSGVLEYHDVKGQVSVDYLWNGKGDCRISGLWAGNISGIGIGYGYDFGFMSFGFRFNPVSRRGYGLLSIEPERIFETTWRETSVSLRIYKALMTGMIGFNGTDVTWRMNGWFSPSVRFLYSSGYPDRGQAVTDSYRIRRNYGIWMAGGEFRYQFGFVEASAGIHAGLSRWCVDRMMNISPDPGSANERIADPVCPCACISAGISLMPDGFVVAGPASVKLYATGGCMFLTKETGIVLKKDLMHGDWSWHVLDPFFGMGVELGF